MNLPQLRLNFNAIALILLTLISVNCGGGGGGDSGVTESTSSTLEKGDLVIGLTDADGDFTAYEVDVVSIKLYRDDGAEVSVLPVASTIDFTEYVEVTELLATTSIAKGNYVSGNMVLDFSQHDIQVEVSGNSISATVVDSNGEAVDQIEMSFSFDEEDLEIKQGSTSYLSLDFDLEATNEVNLSGATPIVTVSPLLIAEINGENLKTQRTRGLLNEVNSDAMSFEMRVRPLKTSSGSFGMITVQVDSETLFEVDGSSFTGLAGLNAMSEVDLDTLVTVMGNLNITTGLLEAEMVSAGDSVLGNAFDFGKGSVIEINGNVLTLRGGSLKRRSGQDTRGGMTFVDLGDLSELMLATDLSVVSVDAIQVGTQLVAYGDAETVSGNRFLGNVQGGKIYDSELQGSVVAVGTSTVTLSLNSVNGRDISLFDFVMPEMFLVSTTSLDLSSLEVNDLVKVEGYFNSENGFDAISILDVSAVDVKASISWSEDLNVSPIISTSDMNAVINIDESILGKRHHYFQGRLKSDLADLGSSLNLYSPTDIGSFTLSSDGESTSYSSFNDFMTVVTTELQEHQMKSMSLKGEFDSNTLTFTVESLRVLLR